VSASAVTVSQCESVTESLSDSVSLRLESLDCRHSMADSSLQYAFILIPCIFPIIPYAPPLVISLITMPPHAHAPAFKRKRMTGNSKELEALDGCFPRTAAGRRGCVYCDDCDYSQSTSNDNLRYHMHEKHSDMAVELGIRVRPSSQPASASSSSSHSPLVDLVDEDSDFPPSLPPVPSFFSLSSASSFSSSSSSPSPSISQPHRILTSPAPSASSLSSKRTKQNKMDQYGTPASKLSLRLATAKANDAQVDLWLYEGLANLLADSKYLKTWLTLFREGSGDIVGRKQIALRAQGRAAVVMNRVTHLLRQGSGVTVGIDGWTNVNGAKVINFCPVSQATAFYFHSAVLKDFSTAAAQHIPVRDGLRAMMSVGICVMAIVTDNEAVNGALYRNYLVKDFPFLLHIPCAAHTVQLCVRAAMELPAMDGVVKSLMGMLQAFKKNKALRINVKAQQALLRTGEAALQVINVVETRWNSILYAGKRLMVLQECIAPYIPLIKATLAKSSKYRHFTFSASDFWYPLKALLDFLVPYQIATDVLQSDAASLADVHSQFATLISAADKLAIPHPLADMREGLMNIIRGQWNDHVNHDIVITCSFLSHDNRYAISVQWKSTRRVIGSLTGG
jgi:hypothetical protein